MNNYPKLIRQKSATTCGQCCVAMLMSCDIKAAIEIIGHDGITSDEDIFCAVGTEESFREGPPPAGVVAIQKHKDPDGEREHWTLWWIDKTLDPANIGDRLWPVSKHLIIDWMTSSLTAIPLDQGGAS